MIGNSFLVHLFVISICCLASSVKAIINGLPFDDIKVRYKVSVQIRGVGHVCGGGIIGHRFILTAAHCLLNRTRHLRGTHLSILARTNSLNITDLPAVTIPVETIFFPKEFHPTAAFNHGDIAVLKITKALDNSKLDSILQLAANYNISEKISTMAGFGWNKYHLINNKGVGSTDGQLRFAVPDILPNDKCERAYPRGVIESEKHVCAVMRLSREYGRYGVCIGDGGSPLTIGSRVIGILSRIASHCDEREKPAVYTRVAHYRRMILNIIEHSHDSEMIELHI